MKKISIKERESNTSRSYKTAILCACMSIMSLHVASSDGGDTGFNVYMTKDKKASLRIGGTFEFIPGISSQSAFFNDPTEFKSLVGENKVKEFIDQNKKAQFRNYNGFAMDNSIFLRLMRKDGDVEYGIFGEFAVNPSPKTDGGLVNGGSAYIYVENNFGKLMLGPYDGPGDTMRFTAANIARGSGGFAGAWSDWVQYLSIGIVKNGNGFGLPMSLNDAYGIPATLISAADSTTEANKIMYYTPRINGLMFGIGYTPSLASRGTNYGIRTNADMAFENMLELGANYIYNYSESVNIRTSIVAEFATSTKHRRSIDNKAYDIERYPLAGFEVGAIIQYGIMSVGGAYGFYGRSAGVKSLIAYSVEGDGSRTKIDGSSLNSSDIRQLANMWNIGITCDYEQFSASIGFVQSNRAGSATGTLFASTIADVEAKKAALNKMYTANIGSLSLEYRPVSGVRTYIEVVKINVKSPINESKTTNGNEAYIKNNSPWVGFLGAQVTF